MVKEALSAAEMLSEQGMDVAVYNMHTIKPIDKDGLDTIFEKYNVIFTVEEHNILGGMGGAIAEYKATKINAPRQVFIGFQDSFLNAGSQRYVWEQAGLVDNKIAEKIISELK